MELQAPVIQVGLSNVLLRYLHVYKIEMEYRNSIKIFKKSFPETFHIIFKSCLITLETCLRREWKNV